MAKKKTFPVTVVARKDLGPKEQDGCFLDWADYHHPKVKAENEHEARRQTLLSYIEQGYRVKETRIEYV